MDWLRIFQVLWPVAVTVIPLVLAVGFLWLRTKFALQADLSSLDRRVDEQERRLSIVEEDCKTSPSRHDLNQGLAVVSGRISGVESSIKGLEQTSKTQHDYVRTLLEGALRK